MGKTILIASGKGGTGKTMMAANLGAMLSRRGHKTVLVDMDMGLRNLDLYLGLENNVVYDVHDVLNGLCRIKQAVIKNKNFPGLFFMASSPKPLDGEITPLHMKVLCRKLEEVFDYVIIDCSAGMDESLSIALGGGKTAILVVTPEYASMRDAGAMKEYLLEQGAEKIYYILNRVDMELVNMGYAPAANDIPANIKMALLGIVQEDKNIRISTNIGMPVVFKTGTYICDNFNKIAARVEQI